jgi:hypothetical protein
LRSWRFYWRYERRFPIKVPLGRRIALWRQGFASNAWASYDFRTHSPRDYLPEMGTIVRCVLLNDSADHIADSKLVFHAVMERWPGAAPALFGRIREGRFVNDPRHADGACGADLVALCRREQRLVLKASTGGKGRSIQILECDDAAMRLNGRPIDAPGLERFVAGLDDVLVTEYLRQADYAQRINPRSLNTLRFLVLRDPTDGRPFIAAVVHRFGTQASGYVDNSSRGGVYANVDLESGVLGEGRTSIWSGAVNRIDRHPDSGEALTGLAVPEWPTVRKTVLEWAAGLPYLIYAGWDVAIDQAHRARAIEVNARPATDWHQTFRPFLADPRIRAFFEAHGVARTDRPSRPVPIPGPKDLAP